MSLRFTIETVGLENISAKMNDLQKSIFGYALPRDLDYAFNIGLQEAQRNVPVKTGALRDSGRVTTTGPLARMLNFPLSYAAKTNASHPTKAGWFDRAVDYIEETLPTNMERSVSEQVGIVSRK
jgi:hypothetical protein